MGLNGKKNIYLIMTIYERPNWNIMGYYEKWKKYEKSECKNN